MPFNNTRWNVVNHIILNWELGEIEYVVAEEDQCLSSNPELPGFVCILEICSMA